jgi:hypothetical protein
MLLYLCNFRAGAVHQSEVPEGEEDPQSAGDNADGCDNALGGGCPLGELVRIHGEAPSASEVDRLALDRVARGLIAICERLHTGKETHDDLDRERRCIIELDGGQHSERPADTQRDATASYAPSVVA